MLRAPPPDTINQNLARTLRVFDKKSNCSFGFTLAEVLITLGIIGVVAALTSPILIKNYQKHVTLQCLKASYSIINQAIETSKQNNGDIDSWDYTIGTEDFVNKYLAPYLKLTKFGAYRTYQSADIKNYYYFDCLEATCSYIPDQRVILHSTAPANIYSLPNGNFITIVVFKSHTFNIGTCVLRIDINGKAKPNMLGKDVFTFSFSENCPKLSPGINNQNQHDKANADNLLKSSTVGGCNKNSGANWGIAVGDACSAVIIKDGWKFRDTYPY